MRRLLRRVLPVLLTCLALGVSGVAVTGAVAVLSVPGHDPGGRKPAPHPTGSSDVDRAVPVVGMSQVAPLRRVVPPDLLAIAPKRVDAKTFKKVKSLEGVHEAITVDAGQTVLRGRPLDVFGIDPSAFRSWTPPATAASDKLWGALARDEFVISFQSKRARRLSLGKTYPIAGRNTLAVKLGASAKLGVPGIDALVSQRTGNRLGLERNRAVFVNAPGADVGKLRKKLSAVLGGETQVLVLRDQRAGGGGEGRANQPTSKTSSYLQLYKRAAATCPGLSWTVLAAIGQVESGHGRNMGPSSAGAMGPMQFMPATWSHYGVDGDGDGRAEIMNPYDAIPAAAKYLCANGAGGGRESLRNAVWHYNHAWWYVNKVLALAESYQRSYT